MIWGFLFFAFQCKLSYEVVVCSSLWTLLIEVYIEIRNLLIEYKCSATFYDHMISWLPVENIFLFSVITGHKLGFNHVPCEEWLNNY